MTTMSPFPFLDWAPLRALQGPRIYFAQKEISKSYRSACVYIHIYLICCSVKVQNVDT